MRYILILFLLLSHQAFALDMSKMKVLDLTHSFSTQTLYWPTSKAFELNTTFHGTTDKGYFYSSHDYTASEHGGTHVDAPIHFAKQGNTLDQIPLDKLMGDAVVIDIKKQCQDNRDYLIQVSDLERWEKKHGAIKPASIVLLNTGFHQYWPDAKKYLGTDKKGQEGVNELSFPGLSQEAASWLVQRQVHAVGIDTASIDYGKSKDYLAHQVLAKSNMPVFENVADLDALEGKEAFIIALPMKIKEGSGGPLRIVAMMFAAQQL